MFTRDYKLSGWVRRWVLFLAVVATLGGVTPQRSEAFIFRLLGRGIFRAGQFVVGAGIRAGQFVRGAAQVVTGQPVRPIFGFPRRFRFFR